MCRLITIDNERVESKSWNEIRERVQTDEQADIAFDKMVSPEFVQWYGEDWIYTGIEPTITDLGVQNIRGEFQQIIDNSSSVDGGLNAKLKKFIENSGISIELADAIKLKLGDNVIANVNFINKTLKLVEGKIKEDTLPEEAAHIYTEFLEQSNKELYTALYNRIVNYPEYKEVKEDEGYQAEYGNDETLYRKEAIGKVMANRIMKKTVKSDTFISLGWKITKQGLADSVNIASEQFEDMFDIAADTIVNSDKHFKVKTSKTSLFQLDTKTASNSVKKLVEEDAKLEKGYARDIDGQIREFYKYLGKEVKKRVTSVVKSIKNYNTKFSPEQQKINDIKAATGTKYHDALNNIAKRYLAKKAEKDVPDKVTTISDNEYRALENYLIKVLSQFEDADVLTEVQIYDPIKDIAGTIDLLIIDKNGMAHILDYKFITIKGDYISIPKFKKEEWDLQLTLYKNILKSNYGITKFGMLRMLPFGIKYNDKTEVEKLKIEEEDVFKTAVPAIAERTGKQNIDKIIDDLYEEASNLRKNKKIKYEDKELRLKSIENAIVKLKIKQDLKPFLKLVNAELDEVEKLLNKDTITDTELNKMYNTAEYYSDIDTLLDMPDVKEIADLAKIAKTLKSKFIPRLRAWAEARNIEFNSETHMKPVTSALANVTTMGSIENPVFRFANRLIQTALDKKDREVDKLEKFFKELDIDSFDKIIDREHGKLIAEYNKEFYEKIKTATTSWKKKNVKLRETLTINGEKVNAKEYFDAQLKKKIETLNKISPEIKDEEIDKFRRYNDFWSEKYKDIALMNYEGNNMYIVPNENWYSEGYKEILKNKDSDISKFYFKIKEIIDEAKLYSNDKIDSRMIPSIEKSAIRKLLDGGLTPKSAVNEFVDSFRIKEYDINDRLKELTLNYTGNIDKDKISYELKQTFLLFAESMYNVKYLSEIEDTLSLAKNVLKNTNYIKVNNLGKPKRTEAGSIVTESGKDSQLTKDTLEYYDKFIDTLVYNKRSYADTEIAGLGVNKVLGGLLNYNAWLKIGWSLLSSTSNLVGGKANQYMEAAKGRFFTTKELLSAEGGFASRDTKSMAIIDFFDISTDNTITKKARNLKISELDKQFNSDWIMVLQNTTEKITQYTTLLAYTKGMTVKDGNIVKAKEGDKTIYDSIEIKDGQVIFPELTEELYGRMKLTVTELNSRLTGAKYDRGKMLYQGHIGWRAVAQFKSWVLPMGKERFGTLTYNDNMGLYEEGRLTQAAGVLFSKHFAPIAMSYLKGLVTFNSRAIVIGSEAALKERYNIFMELNPNFKDLTFPQYVELYHENIKSLLREMQMWAAMMSISISYAAAPDDDRNKTVVKYLDRFVNELSYFYSLDSYLALGGLSLPLVTTAEEFIRFTKEVFNNSWGIATGDSELINPEKLKDRGSKITFGWRAWDRLYEDIANFNKQ